MSQIITIVSLPEQDYTDICYCKNYTTYADYDDRTEGLIYFISDETTVYDWFVLTGKMCRFHEDVSDFLVGRHQFFTLYRPWTAATSRAAALGTMLPPGLHISMVGSHL